MLAQSAEFHPQHHIWMWWGGRTSVIPAKYINHTKCKGLNSLFQQHRCQNGSQTTGSPNGDCIWGHVAFTTQAGLTRHVGASRMQRTVTKTPQCSKVRRKGRAQDRREGPVRSQTPVGWTVPHSNLVGKSERQRGEGMNSSVKLVTQNGDRRLVCPLV